MLKKIRKSYWTAFRHSASPSSQWAAGWTVHRTKDKAGKIPHVLGLALPPVLGGPSLLPQTFLSARSLLPCPIHGMECGLWERQSHSGDHGKEGLRSPGGRPQEALCSGGISSVLLGQPCRRMGPSGCPQRGWSPTHVDSLRSQRSGSPPWCLSLHPSWPPVLMKAMI